MLKAASAVVIALVIVVGGIVGFNLYRDRMIEESFANRSAPPVAVSTTTLEPSEWQPTIESIGTLDARRGTTLSVQTAGVVTAAEFDAGDEVRAGDEILRLDDAVEQAALAAAETAAALDEQSLQRQRELRQRNVNTEADLDEAQASAAASAAEVRRAAALLQEKRVLAPFDGMLGIPRVVVGQYLRPGDPVATLQDFSRLHVDFSLPQQDLDRVAIGQRSRVRIDGRDEALTGEVTGIDADVDPGSRLVQVRVRLDETDTPIRPGKFVRIEVELPAQEDVLAIPQTALVTSLYGDHVFVVEPAGDGSGGDGEPRLVARQVFVEVGNRGRGQVQILDGLEAGARVIDAGQNRLSDGATVSVNNEVDPNDSRGDAGDGSPRAGGDEEDS